MENIEKWLRVRFQEDEVKKSIKLFHSVSPAEEQHEKFTKKPRNRGRSEFVIWPSGRFLNWLLLLKVRLFSFIHPTRANLQQQKKSKDGKQQEN